MRQDAAPKQKNEVMSTVCVPKDPVGHSMYGKQGRIFKQENQGWAAESWKGNASRKLTLQLNISHVRAHVFLGQSVRWDGSAPGLAGQCHSYYWLWLDIWSQGCQHFPFCQVEKRALQWTVRGGDSYEPSPGKESLARYIHPFIEDQYIRR